MEEILTKSFKLASLSSSPKLSLQATADTPPSLHAVPHQLALVVQLEIDSLGPVPADDDLASSGFLKAVHGWFEDHKTALNLDRVEYPTIADSSIKIQLHSFTRAARVHALSLPRSPPTLSTIHLAFHFVSTARATTTNSQEKVGPHLLTQIPSTPAHFVVAALVDQALSKLSTKLVQAFPLAFNPKWIDRLAADSSHLTSVATSLTSILSSSSNPSITSRASFLSMQLQDHLKFAYEREYGNDSGGEGGGVQVLEDALRLACMTRLAPDPFVFEVGESGKGKGKKAKAKSKGGGRGRKKEVNNEEHDAVESFSDNEGGGDLELGLLEGESYGGVGGGEGVATSDVELEFEGLAGADSEEEDVERDDERAVAVPLLLVPGGEREGGDGVEKDGEAEEEDEYMLGAEDFFEEGEREEEEEEEMELVMMLDDEDAEEGEGMELILMLDDEEENL